MSRNLFIDALIYLAIGYGGLFLYAQAVVNSAMFLQPPSSYLDGTEIIKVTTSAGEQIALREFAVADAEYTIIYHHGNEEDIGRITPLMQYYQSRGHQIVVYDYPGYGLSSGKPTEASSVRAAEAVWQYLTTQKNIAPEKLIHLGSSIGTGVAVEMAKRHPSGGVILHSPMLSAFRVITRYPIFPFDRFYNNKKIDQIKAPLWIVHGTEDSIISAWHGRELFKLAKEPKQAYWVEDADHNDLLVVAGENYWQKLTQFFDLIKGTK